MPDLLDQLKQKYQPVLDTIQKEGAELQNLNLDGNQLYLKATAVSEASKNRIWDAIKAVDPNLIFVVLANSKLVQAGEAANLPMVHEIFADRAYEDDGNLVSRRKPGAVLHDPKQIADRVVRMVQDGAVVSVTGKVIKMRTDTICIHGDTPGAPKIAAAVAKLLREEGVELRALGDFLRTAS